VFWTLFACFLNRNTVCEIELATCAWFIIKSETFVGHVARVAADRMLRHDFVVNF
jgi:hypothetical protein